MLNFTIRWVIACTVLLGIPTPSYADEVAIPSTQVNHATQPNKIEINDADTQLAQRMAIREAIAPRFEYGLSVGYRIDTLSWNIADNNVNVASLVKWQDTVIAQLRADAKLYLNDDWQLRGSLATGAVHSGTNQDSDYAASNYKQEYSRSNNQSGGAVRDFTLALGKKIRLPDLKAKGKTYPLHIVPLAGVAIHQQSFTMIDGYQTIPANGAFPNLHNSYDTTWKSLWLGAEGLLNVNDKLTLVGTGEYHFADYTAEANWNLRNDLAHPVSFKHIAKGRSKVASVGVIYRLNQHTLFNTALGYQSWHANGGTDQTFFANGTSSNYRLNNVGWSAWTLTVGGVYQF